ncbi:MAG: hypothetical protein EXR21_05880 [Flavobacteriaceae bacterium]|nr:hypothetical protein [Flavobacteriaceae bacterium]
MIIISIFTDDKIVEFLSFSIFGIVRMGLLLYGQTLVKKLNRDYTLWGVFLFFFTSIALIFLGQFDKLKKEIVLIAMDTAKSNNPNNLPSLTFGTDSNLLIESIQNDSFTLKYMVNNYRDFIKENTSLFPILAAYQLNKRGEMIDAGLSESLDKFAKEKGYTSFAEILNHASKMNPDEINKNFS